MIDVAAIILAALAYLGSLLVVELVALAFDLLVGWFLKFAAGVAYVPDEYAVTVAESIATGNVSIVQGVFNTSDRQFTKVRRVKGHRADRRLLDAHRRHSVAIWQ